MQLSKLVEIWDETAVPVLLGNAVYLAARRFKGGWKLDGVVAGLGASEGTEVLVEMGTAVSISELVVLTVAVERVDVNVYVTTIGDSATPPPEPPELELGPLGVMVALVTMVLVTTVLLVCLLTEKDVTETLLVELTGAVPGNPDDGVDCRLPTDVELVKPGDGLAPVGCGRPVPVVTADDGKLGVDVARQLLVCLLSEMDVVENGEVTDK